MSLFFKLIYYIIRKKYWKIPVERRNNIMNNNKINSNEFLEFLNSEKMRLLDILKIGILLTEKIDVVYVNFYEQYLSDSSIFEEIMNQKEKLKTWFFKSDTNEIFFVDSDYVDDLLKSQGTNKLTFIQEVNVNKIFEDPNVLAAAIDFIDLPAHRKTARSEAIEFIAEAAKELFHKNC